MFGGIETVVALALKPVIEQVAVDLAKLGWEAVNNRVRGDKLERAIARVIEYAYHHLQIVNRAAGLQEAERAIVEEGLRHFISHPDVLHQLIDLALATGEPPIDALTRRFAFYDGDLENFPRGFTRAITTFIVGLRAGMHTEAQTDGSPLQGRVTLVTLVSMRESVDRVEQKVDGIAGETAQLRISLQGGTSPRVTTGVSIVQADPPAPHQPGQLPNAIHQAITDAARPTLEGDPQMALGRLTQLREEQWDSMDLRARYRLLANIGNAYERRQDQDRAAVHYQEAATYQPDDPDAQAFAALALVNQGRNADAFALTGELIPRFPYHERLNAIRARTAPAEWSIEEIERVIPAQLHGRPEVAVALGQRALDAGDLVCAERHARAAITVTPDWDGAQTLLASILLTDAQPVWTADFGGALPTAQMARVEEAVALLSAAIRRLQPIVLPSALVGLRLNRSLAYRFLGKELEAGQDIQAAVDLAPMDPDVVLRYGTWLWEHNEQERAITLLAVPGVAEGRPDLVLTLARWRFTRHSGTDLAGAAQSLSELLKRLGPADAEYADDTVSLLVAVHLAQKENAAARAVLESPQANALSTVARKVLASDIDLLDDNREQAEALAREALAALEITTTRDDLLQLAFMVEAFEWWDEALPLWQRLASTDRLTPSTRRLLSCAEHAGADEVLLTTCRALRKHGIWDPQCFDNELALLERYHAFPEAQALMEEYLRAPTDSELAVHVRIRLALLARRTDQPSLADHLLPELPPVEVVKVWQGRAVVDVLRFGDDPADAINYAYSLWRRFPDEYEAFDAVIASFNMINGPEIKLDTPAVVVPGCAVSLREVGKGEAEWWVIEDAPGPLRAHREIAPDSPLARALIGKSQGEELTLPGSPFYPRVVRIEEIVPKAVYRWRWCIEEQSRYFPDRAYVQAVPLPTGPDGEPDPTLFLAQAEQHAKEGHRVNDLYRRGPVTIATFAATAGASIVETMAYLAAEQTLPVHTGPADGQGLVAAYSSVRQAEAFVVDLTALGTLMLFGEEAALTTIPVPLVVTSGAVEHIRSLLKDTLSRRQGGGHLIWTPEGTVLVEHSPEQQRARADRLQALLSTIEGCCQIEPGTALAAVPRREREQLIRYCGREGAEAVAIAQRPGRVLWVDDTWVGIIARQICGVQSAWTHAILVVYRETQRLDPSWVARTGARLQAVGYTGTLLSPSDILQALADGQWLVTNPLVGGALDSLASPLLSTEGAVRIAARLLKPIWQQAPLSGHSEAVTWRLLERLGSRQEGELIVGALRRSVTMIFGLDVVRAQQVTDAIDLWLTTGQRGRLIVPGSAAPLLVPASAPQFTLPG